ncbi:MAG: hydrogenase nickel incorporation protein HypB [Gammaproteobacteria bacterium]|nr:hydrogenase nickel incorporation protein HypB [Gammaproteobacteria bacterium]
MCQTCGCANTTDPTGTQIDSRTLEVMKGLLSANDAQATRNRDALGRHNILAINLMSSPGAGKTTLLEATAELIPEDLRVAVIEGDLATENDADRVRAAGFKAVQITTGNACHLDAAMIAVAMTGLNLHEIDILFIENVGNLVCPASFDLGQHHNVTLLSVPEGDDKPLKYPVMFRAADLVLLTKMDLAPHLPDFRPRRARDYVRQLATPAHCLDLSASSGVGMQDWVDWVTDGLDMHRLDLGEGSNRRPRIESDSALSHDHPETANAGHAT